jgi:hypothetical protein
MVKFGQLKSKIEQKLIESYSNQNFKSELATFKNLVLGNKNVSKLYFHYDELTSNKGLNESESKEFINESLNLIKKIEITETDLKEIKKWVRGVKTTNQYKSVDDLISEGLDATKIVNIKNKLSSILIQEKKESVQKANLPLKSMVNVANQTLMKHFEKLNESDKKELSQIINLDDNELVGRFSKELKDVINKLNVHLNESTDEESKNKIVETIDAIKGKEINKLELYKLSKLNESL